VAFSDFALDRNPVDPADERLIQIVLAASIGQGIAWLIAIAIAGLPAICLVFALWRTREFESHKSRFLVVGLGLVAAVFGFVLVHMVNIGLEDVPIAGSCL
tara:strand:+ start:206 stop:508 length:303 start_codon:yes stop_codon:yes gene_type:complete